MASKPSKVFQKVIFNGIIFGNQNRSRMKFQKKFVKL